MRHSSLGRQHGARGPGELGNTGKTETRQGGNPGQPGSGTSTTLVSARPHQDEMVQAAEDEAKGD